MPKESATEFRLPVSKPVKPVGLSRPLSDVASQSDYRSKVMPRKWEAKRIQADKEAAALGYFHDRNSFLRWKRWSERHLIGNDKDFRPFLFVTERNDKNQPVQFLGYDKIAKRFDAQVLKRLGDRTQNEYILKYLPQMEEAQLKKIGSKSRFESYATSDLHKRVEDLKTDGEPLRLNMAAVNKTIDFMRSWIPKGSVKMASLDTVWNTIPTEDDEGDLNSPSLDTTKNSGPPFYLRGWMDRSGEDPVKTKVGREIYRHARYYERELLKGRPVPWRCVMAHRLTPGGHNEISKERPVMAMEKANAVLGKRVTYHLNEALRHMQVGANGFKGRPFIAYNDAPLLDVEMQHILNYQKSNADIVINSSDVSAFDSSCRSDLIMLAGEIIGHWMRGGQKYVRALAESMAVHTSVLTPYGFKYPSRGGVHSGDWGTNVEDSVVSEFVFWYGHFAGMYELHGAYAQGDDGIQIGRGITTELISELYATCGFDANVDKQWEATGTLLYLQKMHVLDYLGGIHPVSRALASVSSHERLKFKPDEWSPEAQTVQIVSALENAVFNPLFPDLVNFVAEADALHLHSSVSPASKILSRAGEVGHKVLISSKEETINKKTLETNLNGFDRAMTNGVLRGEKFPRQGGREYFQRAYGHKRLENLNLAVN